MKLIVKQKKYRCHARPRFNVEIEIAGEIVFGVGPYLTREQARKEGEQAFLDAWLKAGIVCPLEDGCRKGAKTCQTG